MWTKWGENIISPFLHHTLHMCTLFDLWMGGYWEDNHIPILVSICQLFMDLPLKKGYNKGMRGSIKCARWCLLGLSCKFYSHGQVDFGCIKKVWWKHIWEMHGSSWRHWRNMCNCWGTHHFHYHQNWRIMSNVNSNVGGGW